MHKTIFPYCHFNSVQSLHLILSCYFSHPCENHTMYLETVLPEYQGKSWWFYWVCFTLNCKFFLDFLLLILIVMRTIVKIFNLNFYRNAGSWQNRRDREGRTLSVTESPWPNSIKLPSFLPYSLWNIFQESSMLSVLKMLKFPWH